MNISCQEREKKEKTRIIDHQLQSNHDMYTHAAPCERSDDCTSNETMYCHI